MNPPGRCARWARGGFLSQFFWLGFHFVRRAAELLEVFKRQVVKNDDKRRRLVVGTLRPRKYEDGVGAMEDAGTFVAEPSSGSAQTSMISLRLAPTEAFQPACWIRLSAGIAAERRCRVQSLDLRTGVVSNAGPCMSGA